MATNRKKRSRAARTLKVWELAYLTGDDSGIIPGSRDAARLKTMRADPDSWLMFGDRTGRMLLEQYPEYKR
jgi:hypothetical protein